MLLRTLAPCARPSALKSAVLGASAPRRFHVSCASLSKDVMPVEAQKLLQAGGCKYLDVRAPQEYQAGHVPSATNLPLMFMVPGGMAPNPEFLAQVEQRFPAKDAELVVGCKSGRRSEAAINILSQAGYTGLVNLTGGFDRWVQDGLPVEA